MGRWALMFLSGVLLGTAWAGEAPPAFTTWPPGCWTGRTTLSLPKAPPAPNR